MKFGHGRTQVSYDDRTFEGVYDSGGRLIQDAEFNSCRWHGCSPSLRGDGSHPRTVVCNVTIIDGEVSDCQIGAAIFENVIVDGLKTKGLLQCFGSTFKHVVLNGNIGRLMVSSTVTPEDFSERRQQDFDRLSDRF